MYVPFVPAYRALVLKAVGGYPCGKALWLAIHPLLSASLNFVFLHMMCQRVHVQLVECVCAEHVDQCFPVCASCRCGVWCSNDQH